MTGAGFLSHVPVWVWAVLALLLVLGGRATRRRDTAVWMVGLPVLLILLALRTIHALDGGAPTWAIFTLAYAAGGLAGYRVQPRWIIERRPGRVVLAGEWVTLATMLGLFALNFAVGSVRAVAPDLLGQTWVLAGFSILEGLAAGAFLGRAIRVLRRPPDAPAGVRVSASG